MRRPRGCSRQLQFQEALCAPMWAWPRLNLDKVQTIAVPECPNLQAQLCPNMLHITSTQACDMIMHQATERIVRDGTSAAALVAACSDSTDDSHCGELYIFVRVRQYARALCFIALYLPEMGHQLF